MVEHAEQRPSQSPQADGSATAEGDTRTRRRSPGLRQELACTGLGGQGARSTGSPQRSAALFATDAFRMACFKILPCSNRTRHEWRSCPYAHSGEVVRRRPLSVGYSSELCSYMRGSIIGNGASDDAICPAGDGCLFAHNVFEVWLHPDKYRTLMCTCGKACKRKICFFAHSKEELRSPPLGPAGNTPGAAQGTNPVPPSARVSPRTSLALTGMNQAQAALTASLPPPLPLLSPSSGVALASSPEAQTAFVGSFVGSVPASLFKQQLLLEPGSRSSSYTAGSCSQAMVASLLLPHQEDPLGFAAAGASSPSAMLQSLIREAEVGRQAANAALSAATRAEAAASQAASRAAAALGLGLMSQGWDEAAPAAALPAVTDGSAALPLTAWVNMVTPDTSSAWQLQHASLAPSVIPAGPSDDIMAAGLAGICTTLSGTAVGRWSWPAPAHL